MVLINCSAQIIEEPCMTHEGLIGKCRRKSSCLWDFKEESAPTLCSSNGLIVCCPDYIEETPPQTSEQTGNLFRLSSESPSTVSWHDKDSDWRFYRQFNLMLPDYEKPWNLIPSAQSLLKWKSQFVLPSPSLSTRRKRISEIKCEEYSDIVTDRFSAIPLFSKAKPINFRSQKCEFIGSKLVVGGEKSQVGEFPHMAALGFGSGEKYWSCGGTLVSENFVLTAAHCTTTSLGPPKVVRLGEFNLKRSDDGANPVDYEISKIIRHPGYKWPAKYNDIALLQLKSKVQFSKYIRPACLNTEKSISSNILVASGWGRIEFAGDQSDILLKVGLNVINNQLCNRLYRLETKKKSIPKGIAQSMLCAGDLNGGKDTCQGDSGGPIGFTKDSNKCVHYIAGITSFGKFCAAKNSPGVYTRVSSYLDWIERTVWSDHYQ